ncbi:protein kinase domain-containing protein [Halosimplex marinum]|uniref:protein kinase domain-containing protein n=1 Tax=Halosimplex marinum TaxID=3396620 RepID=UPI003F55571D
MAFWRRSGGESDDGDEDDTQEVSPEEQYDKLLDEASDALARGQSLYQEGGYGYARSVFKEGRDAAERALELAETHDLDGKEAEGKRATANQQIQRTDRKQFNAELDDFRPRINDAKETLYANDLDEAERMFDTLDEELAEYEEEANRHDLEGVVQNVRDLRTQCRNGLESIESQRLAARLDDCEGDLTDLATAVESRSPSELRDRLDRVATVIDEVETDCDDINDPDLEARIDALREDIERQRARVDSVEALEADLERARDRLNAAENGTGTDGQKNTIHALDEAASILATARETAEKHDLTEGKASVSTLEERCEEQRAQSLGGKERAAADAELQAALADVRTQVDDAESALESGDVDDAVAPFHNAEATLTELADRATEHELSVRQADIETLRDRCETGLAEAGADSREQVIATCRQRIADVEAELDGIEEAVGEESIDVLRERLDQADRDQREVKSAATEVRADAVVESAERAASRVETLRERIGVVEELEETVSDCRAQIEAGERSLADDRAEDATAAFEAAAEALSDIENITASHGLEAIEAEGEQLRDRLEDGLDRVPDTASDPPEKVPEVLQVSLDYDRLDRRNAIGKGGNADVYLVETTVGTESYDLALKEPRFSETLHSETLDRFVAEAETWSRLDGHDHIVDVVDWDAEPIPWIAMEYMDGGDMTSCTGELPHDQALWVAVAVTKGVRHAHRRGVAHLDLKPENVLFREVEGAWDVPKVADWGLSKQLLDHSKSVDGFSPHYAAPEQFDDDYGETDDITDIYQLGAVFYDLFTGHPPFEGPPASVMRDVLTDQPQPPSDVADVPPGLDEVLLTALAKDRSDRYEDILYLRDALEELLDEH